MKVIGNGAPVRIYVTRAELEAITSKSKPGIVPVLPIGVPAGVPVFVNDDLVEGVILCASEFPEDNLFHRVSGGAKAYPSWEPYPSLLRGKGDDDGE